MTSTLEDTAFALDESLDFLPRTVGPGVGPGRIAGTVTVESEPQIRPVALLQRNGLRVVSRGLSAPDGAFEFYALEMHRFYTVLALDTGEQFDAVVADMIKPVANGE